MVCKFCILSVANLTQRIALPIGAGAGTQDFKGLAVVSVYCCGITIGVMRGHIGYQVLCCGKFLGIFVYCAVVLEHSLELIWVEKGGST